MNAASYDGSWCEFGGFGLVTFGHDLAKPCGCARPWDIKGSLLQRNTDFSTPSNQSGLLITAMPFPHFSKPHPKDPQISNIPLPPTLASRQHPQGLAMAAMNCYGRGIGRHGQSPFYSASLLETVRKASRGSVERGVLMESSGLCEMVAAGELAGVDCREARGVLGRGC